LAQSHFEVAFLLCNCTVAWCWYHASCGGQRLL